MCEIQALNIREAIEQTAARGDVVITAHAASHALEPSASILRVLVDRRRRSIRAVRVSEEAGVDIAKAERTVKAARIAARRDLSEAVLQRGGEDSRRTTTWSSTLDLISLEQAAAIVAGAAAEAVDSSRDYRSRPSLPP